MFRTAVVLMAVVCLAPSVFAQQGRQRRVFTNEDVARPAPPPPAPEPAAEKAPPAEAAPAAGTAAAAEPPAEDAPPTPKEQLQRMTNAQTSFQNVLDEFNKREQSATDAAQQARWHEMAQCLLTVMQANQRILLELQEQVKQLESAPAPAAPPAATQSAPPPTPR